MLSVKSGFISLTHYPCLRVRKAILRSLPLVRSSHAANVNVQRESTMSSTKSTWPRKHLRLLDSE